MDIPGYNQKRNKAEFAQWASQWVADRMVLARLHELNRHDRESKRMREEAFVVYQYVKQFYRNRDISIELRDGSQPFDAIIYAEDDSILEYVEVTGAPEENHYRLRDELVKNGGYSLETILRHHPSLTAYADIVSENILKKLAKDYPPNTTLLVALSSEMIVEQDDCFNFVLERIDPTITAGNFTKIVIFDEAGTHYKTIQGKR